MDSVAEQSTTTLTRASSIPTHQEEIKTRRTEIIILAIAVLFLVGQLVLIIWLLLPSAVARKRKTQRVIGGTVMSEEQKRVDGDGHQQSRCRRLRRSSTWNGRSTAMDLRREYLRQRSKPDSTDALDLQSPLSSLNAESDSDGNDSKNGWDRGLAAAATALRKSLSPGYTRSPLSSPELELESPVNGVDQTWTELALWPGSSAITGRFSPRSPRLHPIDQATINAIMRTPGSPPRTKLGSNNVAPMAELDDGSLATSYYDPLGAKRRAIPFWRGSAETKSLDIEESRIKKRQQDS